jgi:hypothetical protein
VDDINKKQAAGSNLIRSCSEDNLCQKDGLKDPELIKINEEYARKPWEKILKEKREKEEKAVLRGDGQSPYDRRSICSSTATTVSPTRSSPCFLNNNTSNNNTSHNNTSHSAGNFLSMSDLGKWNSDKYRGDSDPDDMMFKMDV